jgi:uncharacterized protein YuzE
MNLIYDTEADALAISLGEGIVAQTIAIGTGTLVDVDEAGRLVAIEVHNPARRWPLEEILEQYEVSAENAEMLRAVRGAAPARWTHNESPLVLA